MSGSVFVKVGALLAILASSVVAGLALVPMTQAGRDLDEAAEDDFATSLARSVYQAVRVSARERSFAFEDKTGDGTTVRVLGFTLVHEGVVEAPAIPSLELLRKSDASVFVPSGGEAASPPVFVFPRPGGADLENAPRLRGGFGKDDRKNGPPDRPPFEVKRVYKASATKGPLDRYGWAIALTRAAAPRLLGDREGAAVPLTWTKPDGSLDAAVYPPRQAAPHDGLYEVEVLVFRDFDPDPASLRSQPVPGGRFTGLLAVGP